MEKVELRAFVKYLCFRNFTTEGVNQHLQDTLEQMLHSCLMVRRIQTWNTINRRRPLFESPNNEHFAGCNGRCEETTLTAMSAKRLILVAISKLKTGRGTEFRAEIGSEIEKKVEAKEKVEQDWPIRSHNIAEVLGIHHKTVFASPTSLSFQNMYLYIWLGVLFAVLWLYFRKTYSYFKHRGVNYLPPVPVLGNMARTILKMEHMVEGLNRLYFAFPDDR
ncbi:hypothetical protein EVAR_75548_1 [Eumeta japonica]|uniref:Uncharacterized protein n=1 Tax=Eumeta variegata TaxID=151549 RepID=A0A4C1UKC1_EUMVA|nr:hypothetical protein EVAR_75548_1 [Eumeta japonica]